MIKVKKVRNPYTKYFLPIVMIWMFDIFYYSNDFTQELLPSMLFMLISILYLTSMHEVAYLYQTLIPRFNLPFKFIFYIKSFSANLISFDINRKLYTRVIIAFFVTVPFLGIFSALFMSADENFSMVVKSFFTFQNPFDFRTSIMFPLFFLGYLTLFIYGFSNVMRRVDSVETKAFDLLIVGIFLGMLNILFMTFLLFQLSYLFGGEAYVRASGINIAEYAREGFFQLMWVMGIVILIVLVIMRRFKDEKLITLLMSSFIIETMVLGFSSLKKMYLYQEIKGVTVLRYYVEWIDYFLLFILALGVYYIVRKHTFHSLFNMIAMVGVIFVTIIASINVDGMVAKHNIEKFKNHPTKLDQTAISYLSVDVLPMIQDRDIKIILYTERDCSSFGQYHFGYCHKLKKYGMNHVKKEQINAL